MSRSEDMEIFANQHLSMMASERTFESAYTRTSLLLLTTGILIYRVFSVSFAPIAIVYMITGILVGVISLHRRVYSFTNAKVFRKQNDTLHKVVVEEEEEDLLEIEDIELSRISPSSSSLQPPLHTTITTTFNDASNPVTVSNDNGGEDYKPVRDRSELVPLAKRRLVEMKTDTSKSKKSASPVFIPLDPAPNRPRESFIKYQSRGLITGKLYFYTSGVSVLLLGAVSICSEIAILSLLIKSLT